MEGCRPRHPLCHSKGAEGEAPPFHVSFVEPRSMRPAFLRADLGQTGSKIFTRSADLFARELPDAGKVFWRNEQAGINDGVHGVAYRGNDSPPFGHQKQAERSNQFEVQGFGAAPCSEIIENDR